MRERPLGELLASVEGGVSVNSEDRVVRDGEIGVLKTSAVTYGTFAPHEHKAVVPAERARAKRAVRGGTIVFSRMNTPGLVAASAYVEKDHPHLFLPDRLWELVVQPGVDARWLSQVLASAPVRAELSARASGTSGSMKNISKEKLLSLPIAVPSLDEQRRIAAVLSAIDSTLAMGETYKLRALTLRQLALRDLSDRWKDSRTVVLAEVAEVAYGLTVNRQRREASDLRPYLTVANLQGDGFDLTNVKTIGVLPGDEPRHTLRDGDVLVVEGNANPDRLGRAAIWRDEVPGALHQNHLIRVRACADVDPGWITAMLNGPLGRSYIADHAKSSSGLHTINSTVIGGFRLPLPALAEQRRCSEALRSIGELVRREEATIDATRALKTAVAQRLLAAAP